MLEDAELKSSRSDKKAKKFVDAHAAVKDSCFKLRISLKAGIEELPDNRVMAEKHFDSFRKKAMKDEDFLFRSFRELDLNFIEPVNFTPPTETTERLVPECSVDFQNMDEYDNDNSFNLGTVSTA